VGSRGWNAETIPIARTKVREGPLPADVSDLLIRWSAGDEAALEPVIAAVYGELRRLARSHTAIEREWEFLRAWLRRELGSGDGAGNREGGSA
jgi:hypothetical protein